MSIVFLIERRDIFPGKRFLFFFHCLTIKLLQKYENLGEKNLFQNVLDLGHIHNIHSYREQLHFGRVVLFA